MENCINIAMVCGYIEYIAKGNEMDPLFIFLLGPKLIRDATTATVFYQKLNGKYEQKVDDLFIFTMSI